MILPKGLESALGMSFPHRDEEEQDLLIRETWLAMFAELSLLSPHARFIEAQVDTIISTNRVITLTSHNQQ